MASGRSKRDSEGPTDLRFVKRPGYNLGISAEVVGRELLRIKKANNNDLPPQAIVDAAKPVDSELHGCFEWDDTKAAAKHRKEQARRLIRSVSLDYEAAGGEVHTVRAFFATKTDEGYLTALEALSDSDMADKLFEEAECGLETARMAIRELRTFYNLLSRSRSPSVLDRAIKELREERQKNREEV